MFRYFAENNEVNDDVIQVNKDDAKHLKNTLRANVGDKLIVIINGEEYLSAITECSKENVVCRLIEKTGNNNEANINITLCQGLPKQTKMEDIIQQNVEVGVKRFIPLITERTIVKLNDKSKEAKKVDRWQKIAKESSKQSKRNIIPKVEDITTFNELIANLKSVDAKIIVPYELEKSKTMKEALSEKKENYYIIIGPEGGFDTKEIQKLQDIGAEVVTLGKRIMRTETAGVVTSAIVLHECDQMNK